MVELLSRVDDTLCDTSARKIKFPKKKVSNGSSSIQNVGNWKYRTQPCSDSHCK